MSIVWSSSTGYPRSMHSTQILLLCVSSVGALAPSTPDGNSAGVMPRLQVITGRRYVEAYCYAFAGRDFLEDDVQQLYWRTDLVQMTRYYMVEGRAAGSASHQL